MLGYIPGDRCHFLEQIVLQRVPPSREVLDWIQCRHGFSRNESRLPQPWAYHCPQATLRDFTDKLLRAKASYTITQHELRNEQCLYHLCSAGACYMYNQFLSCMYIMLISVRALHTLMFIISNMHTALSFTHTPPFPPSPSPSYHSSPTSPRHQAHHSA